MSSITYKLLEINVISAQDLATIGRSMHTYVIAWINSARKLTTRTDPKGHNNPKWNDKFVFRVDDDFLNSETAAVMIEIYNQAWLRDVIVGSARVLVSSLIPYQKSSTRFVALQIRRPSGRPQGILNVCVSVHDGTMKSMPLCSELSSSGLGYLDDRNRSHNTNSSSVHTDSLTNNNKIDQLRRTKSERSWSVMDDQKPKPPGSTCNGSMVGTEVSAAAPANGKTGKKAANGSDLYSDVGPSPSVVAAAVAKGLYPIKAATPKDDAASSILQWSDDQSEEGLRSKLERWRMEFHPSNGRIRSKAHSTKRKHASRRSKGKGAYTCFGKAFGCEFTIVCGAGNGSRRKHRSKVHLSPSDNNSGSYVSFRR
ncbi:hypothetical protein Nepgr_001718 [Nepenthes gracilis]|uniref:C2 domain-containing protein n=1 Tax=Nepenthes gracilis TaxID=150966 RepID=A0AAD3P4Y3_NEPGR|nr:hypothetical protein Nepgr_001718 [Nepenthes gracilis]